MPKMIPDINPEKIKNVGEKIVYSAFKEQLPENWVVRYNFDCCIPNNGRLGDCEADFIVAAPEYGLMFVEVKGSNGYESSGGKWFNVRPDGSKLEINDPFFQANRTKHTIIDHFSKLLRVSKQDFPGIYGHVVMYPNARVRASIPSSQDRMIIFTYGDMSNLKEKMISAFKEWGFADQGGKFRSHFERMKKLLEEDSEFVPVAAADSDEDERKINELTRMQYNSFKAILNNKRVHIKGVAGSGKTVIANWGANALADERKKVLYLCYNNLLASWMNSQKEKTGKFEIYSFFSFCRKIVEGKGGSFQQRPGETDFYEKRAIDLSLEAIDKMVADEKYDAVFVDEAQDFNSDWWFVIENLLKDEKSSALYLFYDPKQGLYNHENNFPEGMICELTQNCRNTKKITNYCGHVINTEIDTFQFAPEGVSPEVSEMIPEPKNRASKIRNIVMQWMEDGYVPSRIAVVSPWSSTNDKNSIREISNIQGIPLINNEANISQWLDGKAIWAKTIKSFKGLEADCLIITDVPTVGTVGFQEEDLYVAVSRAKSRLVFIPSSKEAETELRKWVGK
jgi:hypothetical protein